MYRAHSFLLKLEDLLERGTRLCQLRNFFSVDERKWLEAKMNDSFANYYAHRRKYSAALQYSLRATKVYMHFGDLRNVAISELHTSYILSRLRRGESALKSLQKVLHFANDGLLDSNSKDCRRGDQMIIVAVAYHNIAVQQVIAEKIRQACVSSQNGRRLIKMCLNYGNSYIAQFESTHRICLDRLMRIAHYKKRCGADEKLELLFESIVRDLYD